VARALSLVTAGSVNKSPSLALCPTYFYQFQEPAKEFKQSHHNS